jgi:hypothetical protein
MLDLSLSLSVCSALVELVASGAPPPPATFHILDDLNSGGAGANAPIDDDLNSGGGGANNPIKTD